MELIEAVRQLRAALGQSQQEFAAQLGISIRSVANYEKNRRPDAVSLAQMAKASIGNRELADFFRNELWKELRVNPLWPSSVFCWMPENLTDAARQFTTAPKSCTLQQLSLIRLYFQWWAASPLWDMKPAYDDESRTDIDQLRERAYALNGVAELEAWLFDAAVLGMDPFGGRLGLCTHCTVAVCFAEPAGKSLTISNDL